MYRNTIKRTSKLNTCCTSADDVKNDGKSLLIHFDGWSANCDYWADSTTTDIHPIGWFDQCGHKYPDYKQQLQPPKGIGVTVVMKC